ncbi:MAG: metallophosphoesterase [Phycisphaerae bacterium]|nr:metallophosphoesterase [Phycisphaerae bacterium]
MAVAAAEKFREAAACILDDPNRQGNLLRITGSRRVIVSGDIHGNRQNLAKIISHASLGCDDAPILVLQEIIHGPVDPRSGCDRSIEIMLRAARLKIDHPDNVYFLMGNHDLAQITGNEITKEGRGVCKSFVNGVNYCFGDDGPEVLQAAMDFCRSLPIAIRFDNAVQVSHSLPSPVRAEIAGVDILTRPYQDGDFNRGGGAYEWTWGRDQTPEQLDELAARLDVEFFILGHRHIADGCMMLPNRAMAINSDGPGGCIAEFPTDRPFPTEHPDWTLKKIITL